MALQHCRSCPGQNAGRWFHVTREFVHMSCAVFHFLGVSLILLVETSVFFDGSSRYSRSSLKNSEVKVFEYMPEDSRSCPPPPPRRRLQQQSTRGNAVAAISWSSSSVNHSMWWTATVSLASRPRNTAMPEAEFPR